MPTAFLTLVEQNAHTIKKILENYQILGKSQTGWKQVLVPSLPSRRKSLVIAGKNYAQLNLKVFFALVQFCLLSLFALCEKWPYSELLWSVSSRIRHEYGEILREILRISPFSVRMQKNTYQNNSEYRRFSRSVVPLILSAFVLIENLNQLGH